jgi:CRP-like cAMP-binding protein
MRVETFTPVEALASAVLFAPRPVLPVTVGAQTACRIVSFPREELLKLCMSDKSILEACLLESGSRIQFLSERLRLTRFATLRQRIADWLLRQAKSGVAPIAGAREGAGSGQGGIRVRAEPTFEKMADLMGVARPSLSRELSRMKDDGLIEIDGRTIVIPSLDTLRRVRSSKNHPR